jgi:drug/metabolite transporter (DMT)-like permease
MGNKTNCLFVKWFILFSSGFAAFCIAAQQGIISLILKSDASYLSGPTMVICVLASLMTGFLCIKLNSFNTPMNVNESKYFTRMYRFLDYVSENFTKIGLLGTVIGFCLMMYSAFGGTHSVEIMVTQIKVGLSTAVYTTIVGIISEVFTQSQLFLIKDELIHTKNKYEV